MKVWCNLMMSQVHVAIMRKSWGLTEKILSGEKKIESRWYMNRSRPWGNISAGDTVYFKNTGEPIKLVSIVEKVMQFDELTPDKVAEILKEFGKDDGIPIEKSSEYYERFKNKKYCILIFLKDVESVSPFEINKTGFGNMAAWLTAAKLLELKKV